MVVITPNAFHNRHVHNSDDSDAEIGVFDVSHISMDTLSISGDSLVSEKSTVSLSSTPIKPDIFSLNEKLPRKRYLGKRKLRRWQNEASFSKLVPIEELEEPSTIARPIRTQFEQLFTSCFKMMVWSQFSSLPMDDQFIYLTCSRERANLLLPRTGTSSSSCSANNFVLDESVSCDGTPVSGERVARAVHSTATHRVQVSENSKSAEISLLPATGTQFPDAKAHLESPCPDCVLDNSYNLSSGSVVSSFLSSSSNLSLSG